MKTSRLLFFLFSFMIPFLGYGQNDLRKIPRKKIPSVASKKAGAFIDVNAPGYAASNYTPEQLVKNILISSANPCIVPQVSNVSVSPNLPANNISRSWGYFHKGTTNFPFKDGIVISTGHANRAGNSYISGNLSDNISSGSDPDLVTAMGLTGTYTNASILEFDFVPTSPTIKFNYLVASEEYYGTFPCSFADGFALLLRPVGSTAPYQNMAILPGGAGPVSITNIHSGTSSEGNALSCGAVNEQYFDGYNPTNIETNFIGRTVPLTATATVTPGQAYHFKMVVADYSSSTSFSDSGWDTAVFLEGGSFDLGLVLLDDMGVQLPPEINVCDNTPTVISTSMNFPNTTYQWFKDGVLIPGATANSYTVVQPGTYKVEVWMTGSTCPVEADVKVNGGTTPTAQNASYLLCATPNNQTFNLQQLQPLLSTTTGAQFKFYENQADAMAFNNNFITNVTQYNTAGTTLFVVVSDGGFCHKVVELKLDKEQTPVAQITADRTRICAGESITLTASGGITYDWVNFPGSGNTQTVTLNTTTTFKVYAIGAKGCRSAEPATITVEVLPKLMTTLQDAQICNGDSVLLDPGIVGNGLTYLWNTGDTSPTITVSNWGVYTLEVNNGICSQMFSFNVSAAPLPIIRNLEYTNGKLTVNADKPPTTSNPLEYSIDNITWQDSSIFEGIQNNTTLTVRVRIKGTHCETSVDFFTFNVSNVITPNNDGFNDVIDFRPFVNFDGFKAGVYDRYGAPVFEFSKMRPIWDGSLQGKPLSTGTYWYELGWKHKSGVGFKQTGWIMLKNRE